MERSTLGTTALRALAAIRIVNGSLGLLAPQVLVRATSSDPDDTAPYYGLRMFGVRTVVLGFDLLVLTGEQQRRARDEAVLIHAVDTVAALAGAVSGDLPRRARFTTVAISGVNTALAVVGRRYAPNADSGAGEVAQRPRPGKEEVGAAAHRDERGHVGDASAHGLALEGERRDPVRVATQDRVGVVVQAGEVGVERPRVGDELELPGDVGAQRDEVQSSSVPCRRPRSARPPGRSRGRRNGRDGSADAAFPRRWTRGSRASGAASPADWCDVRVRRSGSRCRCGRSCRSRSRCRWRARAGRGRGTSSAEHHSASGPPCGQRSAVRAAASLSPSGPRLAWSMNLQKPPTSWSSVRSTR